MNGIADAPATESVAKAMDQMYRWQLSFYDFTRKPYLLGRDRLIASLSPSPGAAVLEIGCGTGRNLIAAARLWPHARFYGFDVSSVMLQYARRAVARAGLDDRIALAQGDACAFDSRAAFGAQRFERIYFSYVLSMIPAWREALTAAADLLDAGASIHVADFGDQHGIPAIPRAALRAWLSTFDVEPRLDMASELSKIAAERCLQVECNHIYGGYAVIASLRRPATLPEVSVLKSQAA
jgi:S-adenosylmethionine-diacylgycerolhomoserine-N-methlytransferase